MTLADISMIGRDPEAVNPQLCGARPVDPFHLCGDERPAAPWVEGQGPCNTRRLGASVFNEKAERVEKDGQMPRR